VGEEKGEAAKETEGCGYGGWQADVGCLAAVGQ